MSCPRYEGIICRPPIKFPFIKLMKIFMFRIQFCDPSLSFTYSLFQKKGQCLFIFIQVFQIIFPPFIQIKA